jgi:hypothetical protein
LNIFCSLSSCHICRCLNSPRRRTKERSAEDVTTAAATLWPGSCYSSPGRRGNVLIITLVESFSAAATQNDGGGIGDDDCDRRG